MTSVTCRTGVRCRITWLDGSREGSTNSTTTHDDDLESAGRVPYAPVELRINKVPLERP